MRKFWKWHVRFRVARWLIHVGLWLWPRGQARDEVMTLLSEWGAKIVARNAVERVGMHELREGHI